MVKMSDSLLWLASGAEFSRAIQQRLFRSRLGSNAVERVLLTRRSVRNYSDKPVREPLIRRMLEAGRHVPTSGNRQPFQFVVITNKSLISEMDQAALDALQKSNVAI